MDLDNLLKINDELILCIEKISNLGFGLSRVNGRVVFVKESCPQDELKVKIIQIEKTYAFAEIIEILSPSPYRVNPICSNKNCGACQLQCINYDYQIKLKKQIIQDVFKSIYRDEIDIRDVIPSLSPSEYRRKIQYSVRSCNYSNKLKIGYYQEKSHDIVDIVMCPIIPNNCNVLIDYIRKTAQKFGVTGYNEQTFSGCLKRIVLRSSSVNESILITFIVNDHKISNEISSFCKDIYEKFEYVSGLCINQNPKKESSILTRDTKLICGKGHIKEILADITFEIGSNTFFQINPECANNLINFVKTYIESNFANPDLLDAYSGIGTFGFALSNICKNVVSVEESEESVKLAKKIQNQNNLQNVEINCMDAKKFFANEKRKFDIVLIDPPRKGCSSQSLHYALKLSKKSIIYVSCNPATLARDLKILTENGAIVKFIQPFDMFANTYHTECVAIINI